MDYTFWWDEENIEHIANHGVEPYEAIDNARFTKKRGKGKYLAYGQTDSGRYLLVVFAPKPHSRLRVVTARDMTPIEKRQTRRR